MHRLMFIDIKTYRFNSYRQREKGDFKPITSDDVTKRADVDKELGGKSTNVLRFLNESGRNKKRIVYHVVMNL